MSLYKKSYALQKMVQFFWPTLYIQGEHKKYPVTLVDISAILNNFIIFRYRSTCTKLHGRVYIFLLNNSVKYHAKYIACIALISTKLMGATTLLCSPRIEVQKV